MNTAAWPTRRVLPMLALLGVFYCFPVGMMPLYVGPTETAYVFPAIALYERGQTQVDAEIKRYWQNEDLIRHRGHAYSNKAPGMILLLTAAAPFVDLLLPGRLQMVQLIYFGRILTVVLPFIGFLFLLGRMLERLSQPAIAWGLVLAYALGSGAGVYATLLYTHDLTAALHGAALILLWRSSAGRPAALAGFLSAYGVITEHLTFVVFAGLAGAAFWGSEPAARVKRLTAFLAGAVPVFALYACYNWASFGHPFISSYKFDRFINKMHRQGEVFGGRMPTFKSLYGLTLSPSRGLLFASPWMALAAAAIPRIWRETAGRERLFLLGTPAVFAAMLTALSTYVGWPGGVSIGPRYLVAVYPFLLFPMAWWLARLVSPQRERVLFIACALIGLSLAVHLVVILAFPMTPYVEKRPFINTVSIYCLGYLQRGWGTYTVANHLWKASLPVSGWMLAGLCAAVIGLYARATGPRWTRTVATAVVAGLAAGGLLFWPWSRIGLDDSKVVKNSFNFYSSYIYGYRNNKQPLRGW